MFPVKIRATKKYGRSDKVYLIKCQMNVVTTSAVNTKHQRPHHDVHSVISSCIQTTVGPDVHNSVKPSHMTLFQIDTITDISTMNT